MIAVAVRIAAVLSAGLIPLLTACSSSPHGVVTGKLLAVGGPAPGVRALPHGHVTAQGSAGTQTVMAARDGRYTLSLPPGVYHLTGQYKSVRCRAERYVRTRKTIGGVLVLRAIHVRPGKTISGVLVLCQMGM
jgi:hypothetical protein